MNGMNQNVVLREGFLKNGISLLPLEAQVNTCFVAV